MPLIKVQTSAKADSAMAQSLLKQLSASLAKHIGKPESYVMTALETEVPMTFGGSFDPVCYIEIKNVGSISPSQTRSMSQDFCAQVEQSLGVPADRTYIEFTEARGALWGWNGSTFG